MESRFEKIREIALNTGKPFDYVMAEYTKVNSEVYYTKSQTETMHLLYTPSLEEEVAKRTEERCRNA